VTGSRTLLADHRQHLNRSMSRLLTLLSAPVEARTSGCYVYDEEDRRYLSCGGYGVFLLGHNHPRVVEAVVAQLRERPLGTRLLVDPTTVAAAAALAGAAPPGLQYVTFTNSGAEAVEVALKLAKANGRHRFLAMDGGFHGKTTGALSVTGRDRYRAPFGPLLAGVRFVPFGDLAALEAALAGGEPAGVIVEPVQAEGGVRLPPPGYLRAVRECCDAHGALLVVDEIQTGLGRLGHRWACDAEGVVPDILLTGKILGGGVVPVGAALATTAVYEPFNRDPLLHSSTFGGNPVAAAAVRATLAVIEEEDVVARARELGDRLLPAVRALADRACGGLIGDVRGRGLLIGVEFDTPSAALDMMTALLRRHVITSYTLNANHVLRLTPPVLLGESDVDWLLDAFAGAAGELGRRHRPDRHTTR
jgi:putrescine aminotransferase